MADDFRKVFSYWNGVKTVFADPLAIHRHLTRALDGAPNEVLSKVDVGIAGPRESYATVEDYAAALDMEARTEVMRFEATEKMLEAVRAVFRMAPFSEETGEGATEEDCRAALTAFTDYVESKKKSPVNSPTSPPTTASTSPSPSSVAPLTTPTPSGCG